MQAVTDATFNNMVLMSEKLVLVFFWATWSGPSRQEAPILQQIANEHTDTLSVVQLDVDQNPQTPRTYNVLQVPTMNLYRDGEVVMQIVGAKPKAALLQDLDGFISSAPPTTATAPTTTTVPTTAPLLRAFSPGSGDHFYTTSVAERDNAVANLGYRNEGVACHVYPEPVTR